ncbi:sugar transferase [Candidatus Saccharibacteria bacterium]|nr:sugar transferase [Candidatus Saccharibacteria bacterium]
MYAVIKRVMDFVFATILLVVFSPLMLLTAALIKIDSRGPVFFRQERVGKGGKIFRIFKFRSMVSDNDMRDYSKKDQYTFVGKIIRRLSIDELPQLFNVIAGEMSLVGPRPWVVEYWTNMNKEERLRASVLPGITGLAQVKGRNKISIFSKIEYDIIYVQNFSFKQDVKILILTVLTVLSGRGLDAGKEGVMGDVRNLRQR